MAAASAPPPLPSISISHRNHRDLGPEDIGTSHAGSKGKPSRVYSGSQDPIDPGRANAPLVGGRAPRKGGYWRSEYSLRGGGGGGSPIHSIDTFRALVRREPTRAASKTHQVRLSGSWRRTPACIRERKEMDSDGCLGRSRYKPQGRKRPTSWKPWCEWTSTNARLTCGKRWTRRMPAVRIRLRREFLEPG